MGVQAGQAVADAKIKNISNRHLPPDVQKKQFEFLQQMNRSQLQRHPESGVGGM